MAHHPLQRHVERLGGRPMWPLRRSRSRRCSIADRNRWFRPSATWIISESPAKSLHLTSIGDQLSGHRIDSPRQPCRRRQSDDQHRRSRRTTLLPRRASPRPSARSRATTTRSAFCVPIHGTNTRLTPSAPTIAPSVFAAYTAPTVRPWSCAFLSPDEAAAGAPDGSSPPRKTSPVKSPTANAPYRAERLPRTLRQHDVDGPVGQGIGDHVRGPGDPNAREVWFQPSARRAFRSRFHRAQQHRGDVCCPRPANQKHREQIEKTYTVAPSIIPSTASRQLRLLEHMPESRWSRTRPRICLRRERHCISASTGSSSGLTVAGTFPASAKLPTGSMHSARRPRYVAI